MLTGDLIGIVESLHEDINLMVSEHSYLSEGIRKMERWMSFRVPRVNSITNKVAQAEIDVRELLTVSVVDLESRLDTLMRNLTISV